MKGKFYLYFLFVCFLFCFSRPVNALQPDQIGNRENKCESPNFELAEAMEDGNLVKVECYATYEEAKKIMNTTENDNLVIIESDVIVDAKYAVIDYEIAYPPEDTQFRYMDVYVDSTSNNTNGYYIRSGTPDDAVMIDIDYQNKRVKIKVAGLTGWMDRYYRNYNVKAFDIVPLVWAKTPQYYQVTENELIHFFPINVYGTKKDQTYSIKIDRKPTMLNPGIYYSYDGHYFYNSMKEMITDYRNETYENAINKEEPYYNYYQYLSFRTKTTYNSDNINQYLEKRKLSNSSKMLLTGNYFIDAQNNYGVNAILMMAIGMNESGRGESNLAQTKNNLFGLNAVDATPNESANYFKSVEDCINEYAYSWLSYGFLQPGDYRFKGANLGNKSEGLNYKYASDPFWGEKAASYYYDLDEMFGFQDYNAYQIAVLNNDYYDTVYAKKLPKTDLVYGNDSFPNPYQYRIKDSTVVVLEEVKGPVVNENDTWYKIQSDPTLDENLNYIGDSGSNPRILYQWDISYVYVPASYFHKVNTPINEVPINPNEPTLPEKPVVPDVPTPTPEPTILPTPTPSETPDPKPTATPSPTPVPTPPPKSISSIITEANYKFQENKIYGIGPEISVETVKANLTNTGGVVTITDQNGNNKESGIIGTGDKISITSGVTENFDVVIYGDITGDGHITAVDYVNVKNHIMGSNTIEGIYLNAADVNIDGNISAVDYVNIKNYIMGLDNVISK